MFKTENLYSDDNRQLCETVRAMVTESFRQWAIVEGDSWNVSKITKCIMSLTYCQMTFAPIRQLGFQASAALGNILLPSSGYDYLENCASSQIFLTIYQTTRHHVSEDHSLKPYWLTQVQNCEETEL